MLMARMLLGGNNLTYFFLSLPTTRHSSSNLNVLPSIDHGRDKQRSALESVAQIGTDSKRILLQILSDEITTVANANSKS